MWRVSAKRFVRMVPFVNERVSAVVLNELCTVHLQWALSVDSTAFHYACIEFVMWILYFLQACLVFMRISYAYKNLISSF